MLLLRYNGIPTYVIKDRKRWTPIVSIGLYTGVVFFYYLT